MVSEFFPDAVLDNSSIWRELDDSNIHFKIIFLVFVLLSYVYLFYKKKWKFFYYKKLKHSRCYAGTKNVVYYASRNICSKTCNLASFNVSPENHLFGKIPVSSFVTQITIDRCSLMSLLYSISQSYILTSKFGMQLNKFCFFIENDLLYSH